MNNEPIHSQRSKEELAAAVSTLAQWAKTLKNRREEKKTRRKTVWDHISYITLTVWRWISLKLRKENQAVKEALSTIERHGPLIKALKKGSLEEKALAQVTQEAIETLKRIPKKKKTRSFFHLLAEIHTEPVPTEALDLVLPGPAILDRSSGTTSLFHNTIRELSQEDAPSQNEIDRLLMKVIRTIEAEKLLPPSQTFSMVHQGKITKIASSEGQNALHLEIDSLPGEHLEFMTTGKEKDPLQFHIKAEQTGFPDPILSLGWSTCDFFLPDLTTKVKLTPHLEAWLKEKKATADALLPHGKLNLNAKKRIQTARLITQEDPEYFNQLAALLEHFMEAGDTFVEAADLSHELIEVTGKQPSIDTIANFFRAFNALYFHNTPQNSLDTKAWHPGALATDLPLSLRELGTLLEEQLTPLIPSIHYMTPLKASLSDFQMKALALTFLQQLSFMEELIGTQSHEETKKAIERLFSNSHKVLDGVEEGDPLLSRAWELSYELEALLLKV